MDNQPQPTTPPPVAPTPEPTASQAPSPDLIAPQPSIAESPKANSNKGMILALVAIGVIVIVIICYFLFLRPKPAEDKGQTTPPDNQQQSQIDQDDVTPVGTVIEDGMWNITFPGYTVGDLTVYNETMGLFLPEGVTDIASTLVDLTDTPADTFTVNINGVTTTSEVYNGTTICGYGETAAPIILAKFIRQPISAPAPEINGTTIQDVIEHNTDQVYKNYLVLGLEDQAGGCELDSARYEQAKLLIKDIFGLNLETEPEPEPEAEVE